MEIPTTQPGLSIILPHGIGERLRVIRFAIEPNNDCTALNRLIERCRRRSQNPGLAFQWQSIHPDRASNHLGDYEDQVGGKGASP
jgi:hypothetical protein